MSSISCVSDLVLGICSMSRAQDRPGRMCEVVFEVVGSSTKDRSEVKDKAQPNRCTMMALPTVLTQPTCSNPCSCLVCVCLPRLPKPPRSLESRTNTANPRLACRKLAGELAVIENRLHKVTVTPYTNSPRLSSVLGRYSCFGAVSRLSRTLHGRAGPQRCTGTSRLSYRDVDPGIS